MVVVIPIRMVAVLRLMLPFVVVGSLALLMFAMFPSLCLGVLMFTLPFAVFFLASFAILSDTFTGLFGL